MQESASKNTLLSENPVIVHILTQVIARMDEDEVCSDSVLKFH